MQAELINVESTIRNEIKNGLFRRNIAQTYALGIRSSDRTDWAKVNQLILDRWSPTGLEWIKKQAWSGKCFN